MKTFFLIVVLAAFSINSYAQILPGHKVDGPVYILDSIKVNVGDTILMGQASGSENKFMYLFDGQHHSAHNEMANKKLVIKGLKMSIYNGAIKKYYAVVYPGGIFNWGIDLDNAIKSGEVAGLNSLRFADSRKPVVIQAAPSVADELIKLKKLLDQGVITKEEFDAQKKKLLKQ